MLRKIYFSIVTLLLAGTAIIAQNNGGAIKVLLKDKTNGETIPFANVVAYQGGVQVGVGTTDMDGFAMIKPLAPGYAGAGCLDGGFGNAGADHSQQSTHPTLCTGDGTSGISAGGRQLCLSGNKVPLATLFFRRPLHQPQRFGDVLAELHSPARRRSGAVAGHCRA